eukprot:gene6731-3403_t
MDMWALEDMWALGVTIYMWVFGMLPFSGSAPFVVYDAIKRQELHLPDSPRISQELTDFLSRLLDKDASTRLDVRLPSATEISLNTMPPNSESSRIWHTHTSSISELHEWQPSQADQSQGHSGSPLLNTDPTPTSGLYSLPQPHKARLSNPGLGQGGGLGGQEGEGSGSPKSEPLHKIGGREQAKCSWFSAVKSGITGTPNFSACNEERQRQLARRSGRENLTQEELAGAISKTVGGHAVAELMGMVFVEMLLPAGSVFISVGDLVDKMYLIAHGEVELYQDLDGIPMGGQPDGDMDDEDEEEGTPRAVGHQAHPSPTASPAHPTAHAQPTPPPSHHSPAPSQPQHRAHAPSKTRPPKAQPSPPEPSPAHPTQAHHQPAQPDQPSPGHPSHNKGPIPAQPSPGPRQRDSKRRPHRKPAKPASPPSSRDKPARHQATKPARAQPTKPTPPHTIPDQPRPSQDHREPIPVRAHTADGHPIPIPPIDTTLPKHHTSIETPRDHAQQKQKHQLGEFNPKHQPTTRPARGRRHPGPRRDHPKPAMTTPGQDTTPALTPSHPDKPRTAHAQSHPTP